MRSYSSVAPTPVTRVCGHRESEYISYQNSRDRAKILQFATLEYCAECKTKIQGWFDATDLPPYPLELPELMGSDKQIKWAQSIRAARLKHLLGVLALSAADTGVAGIGMSRAITAFALQADARFWIQDREEKFGFYYFLSEAAYFVQNSYVKITFCQTSVFGQLKVKNPHFIADMKARYPAPLPEENREAI